jgi:hypothetical protein
LALVERPTQDQILFLVLFLQLAVDKPVVQAGFRWLVVLAAAEPIYTPEHKVLSGRAMLVEKVLVTEKVAAAEPELLA